MKRLLLLLLLLVPMVTGSLSKPVPFVFNCNSYLEEVKEKTTDPLELLYLKDYYQKHDYENFCPKVDDIESCKQCLINSKNELENYRNEQQRAKYIAWSVLISIPVLSLILFSFII